MEEAQEKIVLTYETADGRVPFDEWLDALRDTKGRAVIRARINRVRLGLMGDCKPVGDGISEARIDFGPGYRVYFAREGNTIIILLCGGDKRSQTQDISKAKEYLLDYRSRDDG
ncbi:type II toxin-antitoxin system RelE/ParE family toxin [Scytonema sp. NUACC26]|uniref:type II toxin-antitoxin system RelE/ParE family toxin n=1 Tax=Scytonema sp. NUACC26 TaxID=3140176 RepID=UPI0034DC6DE7